MFEFLRGSPDRISKFPSIRLPIFSHTRPGMPAALDVPAVLDGSLPGTGQMRKRSVSCYPAGRTNAPSSRLITVEPGDWAGRLDNPGEVAAPAVAVLSSAAGAGLVTAHLGSHDFARAFTVGAACAVVSIAMAVALVPAVVSIHSRRPG